MRVFLLSPDVNANIYFQGGVWTPDVMYTSHMFAKILLRVHTSRVWKAMLSVTSEHNPLGPPVWKSNKDEWMECPPLSMVVFAATLTVNALRCCAAGGDQSWVPMDEPSHRQIYSELFTHIERDWDSPKLGNRVKAQLKRALNGIQ